MRAIKKARKIIETDPTSKKATTLSKLIVSLETETDFPLKSLYHLNMDDFNLAMEVMRDWRLDRYYEGKAKAIDIALQANAINKGK
jgi:hypothetical protein